MWILHTGEAVKKKKSDLNIAAIKNRHLTTVQDRVPQDIQFGFLKGNPVITPVRWVSRKNRYIGFYELGRLATSFFAERAGINVYCTQRRFTSLLCKSFKKTPPLACIIPRVRGGRNPQDRYRATAGGRVKKPRKARREDRKKVVLFVKI